MRTVSTLPWPAKCDGRSTRGWQVRAGAPTAPAVPHLTRPCACPCLPLPADDPHMKANLLLQAHMGRLPLPIADYLTDTRTVLDNSLRILQARMRLVVWAGLGRMGAGRRLQRAGEMHSGQHVPGGRRGWLAVGASGWEAAGCMSHRGRWHQLAATSLAGGHTMPHPCAGSGGHRGRPGLAGNSAQRDAPGPGTHAGESRFGCEVKVFFFRGTGGGGLPSWWAQPEGAAGSLGSVSSCRPAEHRPGWRHGARIGVAAWQPWAWGDGGRRVLHCCIHPSSRLSEPPQQPIC